MLSAKLSVGLCGAAAAAMVVGIASNASAAPLVPGGIVPPSVTVDDPADGTFVDSVFHNFSTTGFSGSVTQWVYQESLAANPLGGLTFVYEFTNSAGSANAISRVTGANYGLFATNVFVMGPGQDPDVFTRSADGNVVGADFTVPTHQLNPGQTTSLLIVRTDAPAHHPGIIAVIDGSSVEVSGFAPIPEPGMLSLLALGGLGLLRRRK